MAETKITDVSKFDFNRLSDRPIAFWIIFLFIFFFGVATMTIVANIANSIDTVTAGASENVLLEINNSVLLSQIPTSISPTSTEFTWLEFDGVNDVVTDDSIVLNFSNGFSFSAWANVQTIDPTSTKPIIEFRNLTSTTPLFNLVARNNTGVDRFYFRELVNSSGCDTTAENATLGDAIFNDWFYLVGTYNAISNNITLHINGVLQSDTGAVTSECKTLLGASEGLVKRIGIGGREGGADFFDGSIDEVRIYNQSLTDAEILEIFNSGRIQNSSLPSDGLILWYSFNEGTGAIAHDLSGNNNNGI